MKDNLEKRIFAVFLLMLAVLVFVALVAVRNVRRDEAASDWVNHTHAVILESQAILSSLLAGDSSLRTYLLTGDARDQNAYRMAYNDMKSHLDVAKALTRNEKAQGQKFVQLEDLIGKRIAFTRAIVQARTQDGLDGARKALAAAPDAESAGEIEHLIQTLADEENVLLRERDKQSFLRAQATRWTVLTGIAVNFVLLAFAGWLIRDDLAARRKAATVLEDANAQLETKVQQRTTELTAANQTLKSENLERRWANQALEHQLKYSQLIINSITDLIFVISRALNVSRINPAVIHATNYDPQQIIAQPLGRLLELPVDPAGGPAASQNSITLAMKEGREIQDRPALLRSRDGRATPVRFNLIPLRDADKVVGAVISVWLCPEDAPKTG